MASQLKVGLTFGIKIIRFGYLADVCWVKCYTSCTLRRGGMVHYRLKAMNCELALSADDELYKGEGITGHC